MNNNTNFLRIEDLYVCVIVHKYLILPETHFIIQITKRRQLSDRAVASLNRWQIVLFPSGAPGQHMFSVAYVLLTSWSLKRQPNTKNSNIARKIHKLEKCCYLPYVREDNIIYNIMIFWNEYQILNAIFVIYIQYQ